MASHRRTTITKADFDKPWKIKQLKRKKSAVVGCVVCHPRKRITNRKVGRIETLEVD